MGSPNGGIIGVVNPTSFGKCTVTSVTASTPAFAFQPGTRLVSAAVVAGWSWRWKRKRWWRWCRRFKNLYIIFCLWSNSLSNYNRSRWSRSY
jgi:hypothetical protein